MLQSFDWRGALETCQEVLRGDPDHVGALETLAHAQWLAGEYKSVVQTTTRLLHLNPHEPGYRYTRGMARLSQGELVLASNDFRTALAQSKDPSFLSQVEGALEAVEIWKEDRGYGQPVRQGSGIRPTVPGVSSGASIH